MVEQSLKPLSGESSYWQSTFQQQRAIRPEPRPEPHSVSTGLSTHAVQRRAQRGISQAAIDSAWEYGRLIHASGAQFLFLGRNELQEARACGADRRALEKCKGLVVLVAGDGHVITVYRNARALADIRRKKPYDRSKSDGSLRASQEHPGGPLPMDPRRAPTKPTPPPDQIAPETNLV